MPQSYFNLSWKDYSKEMSSVSWRVTEITAANQVATVALLATLQTAAQSLSLANLNKADTTLDRNSVSTLPSSNPLAQRESKWLLRYHDAVTFKVYRSEIPAADLIGTDGNLLANSDEADIASAEWSSFINAFNAVVKAPDTGNSVLFDDAKYVGRST